MSPRKRLTRFKDLPPNLYLKRAKYFEYRAPNTGKTFSMGTDRAQAISAARQLNNRLMSASDLVARVLGGGEKTVTDVIDAFIETEVPTMPWGAETAKNNTFKLNRISREYGKLHIKNLDRKIISDFLTKNCHTADAHNKWRGLFKAVLAYAVEKQYCDVNEAEQVRERSTSKVVDSNKKKRQRMSKAEFIELRELANPWLRNAMDLSLLTLQARNEIVKMKYADIRDGKLFVIRQKTKHLTNRAFIRIPVEGQLEELISRTRDNIASPFIIHRKPDRLRREWIDGKEHWSQVEPQYLSKAFKKVADRYEPYDRYTADEKPTYHEIRSLGIHLYRKAGLGELVQDLTAHTDPKLDDLYEQGHAISDEQYTMASAANDLETLLK